MENNSDFIQILLEKIEKDDLPTNVFDVEGTDPLVLLGKMNEIIGQLSNFQSSVNSSNTTANDALSKANESITASSQALSNANNALTTANQAITTANQTIDTANQSLETAQEAKGIADSANQNSGQALTTANEAKSTAENALEQVTQGLGTKVKDNSGNILSETTFVGVNGVNVDMQEQNPNNFVISLEQTITNQIQQNKNNITQLNNDVSDLGDSVFQAANTAHTALTTANGAVSKNTEQDNSISTLQTADTQNVKISGDQNITGTKNFNSLKISNSPVADFVIKRNENFNFGGSTKQSDTGATSVGSYELWNSGKIVLIQRYYVSGTLTVTFPFAFKDVNYSVLVAYEGTTSGDSLTFFTLASSSRTTTSFQSRQRNAIVNKIYKIEGFVSETIKQQILAGNFD